MFDLIDLGYKQKDAFCPKHPLSPVSAETGGLWHQRMAKMVCYGRNGATKAVQWVKEPGDKSDNLNLIPGTHMKIASDLHMCTMTQAHEQTEDRQTERQTEG